MLEQSGCYTKYFEDVESRLDENYNHPKYAEIDDTLNKTHFDVVSLGEQNRLFRITKGRTPKNIRYSVEGIPFIGAGNINFGQIDMLSAPRIDEKFHRDVLTKSQLKKGNVLATMAGTIGNCASYETDEECNCNQAIAILTINQQIILPKFLAMYLNSRIGNLHFLKLQKIADQPNIGFDEIKTIKIVLPDHDTQIKIILEINKIEDNIREIEDQIENIKKKSTKLMLDELNLSTPKMFNDSYFFKTGRDIRSPYFSVPFDQISERLNYLFYDPKLELIKELSENYSTTTLGEISDPHKGEQPDYVADGGVLAIKTVDMKDAYIDYDHCLHSSFDAFSKFPSSHVKKDDILIASTGYVSLGKIDVYDKKEEAMASQDLTIVSLKEGYDPYFITYFLRSAIGKMQLEKWWTGSSGQIHLQPDDVKKIIIPNNTAKGIPLEKQQKIAKKITDELTRLTEFIHDKEDLIQKSQTRFEHLIGVR